MSSAFDRQLDLVEQQFSQVAAFLASGNAPQLETASALLQALRLELARLLQSNSQISPAQRQATRVRVRELATGLQVLRDGLSRQAAFTQQSLQVVIPTAQPKSTYGSGNSVYGGVPRQAGVHRYLAA